MGIVCLMDIYKYYLLIYLFIDDCVNKRDYSRLVKKEPVRVTNKKTKN
jgi:hypothetical protein